MREQLIRLRERMAAQGVDWVMVPTEDFHGSEYVGDHFKGRTWLTGFTGSAGTALVGRDWAGLWTDGRYFLQAGQQLAGSGFELMRMGEPGVPRLQAFLREHLEQGEVLAFDGRTVNARTYLALREIADGIGAALRTDLDLVGEIWTDRPPLSAEPVWELPLRYAGRSRADKLADVREALRAAGADALVLASLEDICWMLNLRGGDVACTPVVLSFCAVSAEEVLLFVNPAVIGDSLREALAADGVSLRPYGEIGAWTASRPEGCRVMMDLNAVNSAICRSLPDECVLLDRPVPTRLPKAVKNPVEVANFRAAHVKDGVAVTRLMYWLKKNIGKVPMDELSVADRLEEFRREQPDYLGPSFHPIIAYGPHGAIVHYGATAESNVPVEPHSFLLADTGGHYLEGTTDITRTFAMGPLTEEEKEMYTRVLLGHLHLAAARFRYGCTGASLDYLAHAPLWAVGMDYNHGTGHGVGYLLSVHEGPQGFRWRTADGRPAAVLEPGMITSDEPGIYLEGKFGVRLENLTVICEDETNKYGRFLHIEYLTMVPFDLEAVDPALMSEGDRALLNEYHRQVRETVGPLLPPEEAAWLAEATRAI